MSMSKLLENGLEAQVINGLTRDNTKVVTVLFTSPAMFDLSKTVEKGATRAKR